MDGVVALGDSAVSGGGEISGFNQHDQMVMGLLRAVADAVIVGAGTLRSVPKHRWTAQRIYPPLANTYQKLRATMGKTQPPLNVIVTAHGAISLDLPVASANGKLRVHAKDVRAEVKDDSLNLYVVYDFAGVPNSAL